MTCSHCHDEITSPHAAEEHPDLCCDCFDLSCGEPVDQVNAERAGKGKAPVQPMKKDLK